MIITHKISLDLLSTNMPERIEMKQGDTYSRALEITLFYGGEPLVLTEDVSPLLRWRVNNPDTGEYTTGICDTLPDGTHMFQISENQLIAILPPQMLSMPGLGRADLLLVYPEKTLATFYFEFYVNPAPVDGTEPDAESFYKLITLDQINAAISALQTWQADMDKNFSNLEHEVFQLKDAVESL